MIGIGPFKPPVWLANRHVQTVVGNGFRPVVELAPFRRLHFPSAHDDYLSVDLLDHRAELPLIVVLHGLSGGSTNRNVRYLMHRLHRLPARVATLNHRGCDGRVPDIPRLYHGGSSDDIEAVLHGVLAHFEGPICLVGLSMGANILLKYFGEQGSRLSPRILGGCSVSSPFDIGACARHLESHRMGRIYRKFLIGQLKKRARELVRRHPGVLCLHRLREVETFPDFDHWPVAALHGFEGAEDYWARCSSLGFLDEIRRPTLLLNARDDPFLRPGSLPSPTNPWLITDYPARGGHLGFITSGLKPWMEERVVSFLDQLLEDDHRGKNFSSFSMSNGNSRGFVR